MAKKEFDNLTGKLKPDYPRPSVLTKLDGVKTPKKPEAGTFKLGEYMRFAWMLLLGEGDKLLHPEKVAGEKAISWITVGAISLGVLIIIIVSLF